MTSNDFNKSFDSYYHARRNLYLYQHIEVDESENLPPGIYASVIRYQPAHPDLDDEADTNSETHGENEDMEDTDWNEPDMEF